MDRFVRLDPQERRIFFEGTATSRNLQGPIIEKDFWVCWTLKELFNLPEIGEHLIFKGGTSLSKVFRVIERFSEDIDVSIDRGFLGFAGDNEPEAAKSAKQKRRRIEDLRTACQRTIAGKLAPALNIAITSKLPIAEKWSLRADEDDPDQQTLLFEYPTCFGSDLTGYIRRAVKIEMGARSDHWPFEIMEITPYVAEQFPKGFVKPSCAVKVLSAERTFWEKATILHAEFHRPADKPFPERYSRHYYDFYELIRSGVSQSAVANLELLERVVEHKSLFFKSSWTNWYDAVNGNLHIAPPEFRLKALRDDYAKMQQMFFGQPPEFEVMMATLHQWESEFNRI
ncbi:MAG TPA: nucleotidyl transferase AbiEii/AbiGii toxin family protein [Clostridia bacterium]|nr:nucleotidyl transferase AbiEii/AbiGii toxin family protein [Clostridia bacterium]